MADWTMAQRMALRASSDWATRRRRHYRIRSAFRRAEERWYRRLLVRGYDAATHERLLYEARRCMARLICAEVEAWEAYLDV
jgi:hypothetical protein